MTAPRATTKGTPGRSRAITLWAFSPATSTAIFALCYWILLNSELAVDITIRDFPKKKSAAPLYSHTEGAALKNQGRHPVCPEAATVNHPFSFLGPSSFWSPSTKEAVSPSPRHPKLIRLSPPQPCQSRYPCSLLSLFF
jgi:hypothetical protein